MSEMPKSFLIITDLAFRTPNFLKRSATPFGWGDQSTALCLKKKTIQNKKTWFCPFHWNPKWAKLAKWSLSLIYLATQILTFQNIMSWVLSQPFFSIGKLQQEKVKWFLSVKTLLIGSCQKILQKSWYCDIFDFWLLLKLIYRTTCSAPPADNSINVFCSRASPESHPFFSASASCLAKNPRRVVFCLFTRSFWIWNWTTCINNLQNWYLKLGSIRW